MKPICVSCRLFFRPDKNGVYFEEGRPVRASSEEGDTEMWVPYKLWVGDRWRCRGCNATIIVGTGLKPLSVHHEPDYEGVKVTFPPAFRVDDC